nr:MAG TPA: hypothetical protein [Caudoviricetes sp.]
MGFQTAVSNVENPITKRRRFKWIEKRCGLMKHP